MWTRAGGPDVIAGSPVYHEGTRRCVFIGIEPRGKSLYSVVAGEPGPAKRLEPGRGPESNLVDLAFSPDGRILLFNSRNSDRQAR